MSALFMTQGVLAPPAEAAFRGGNGRVVFIGLYGYLYSMNPNGSGLVTLRKTDGDALPVWSPDGGKIAFSTLAGSYDQVFVMNSNGTGLRQLTTGAGSDRPLSLTGRLRW